MKKQKTGNKDRKRRRKEGIRRERGGEGSVRREVRKGGREKSREERR